jgi:hypothetical protein
MRRFVAIATVALATFALAAMQAFAAKRPAIQAVDYFQNKEALGPSTKVEVFGNRIESLKIKASFGGESVKATTSQDRSISGHPWLPDHSGGRRALLNIMENSIDATGAATLKLIAKNDAGTTKKSAQIVWSQCHFEPPIYPFSCSVEL